MVWRRPLPAVERHPQQSHHALGRDHRDGQRLSPAIELRQRQHARSPGPPADVRAPDPRRITRTEYDGTITVIADSFDGKPLNSPNDIVCKSDGSIWFTDPPFGILGNYEGEKAEPELPTNVYRWDPASHQLAVVAGDINRPNGLAFSPDESILYIIESGSTPRVIRAYDVIENGTKLAGTARRSSRPRTRAHPTACDWMSTATSWCGWGCGAPTGA